MTLFDAIEDFFRTQLQDTNFFTNYLDNMMFNIGGEGTIDGSNWLIFTLSFVAYAVIVVLCCLFVYKIIKLIGGLIR